MSNISVALDIPAAHPDSGYTYHTNASAVKFLKAQPKGTRFIIFVERPAHFPETAKAELRATGFGLVALTREAVIEMARSFLTHETEDRGGLVRINLFVAFDNSHVVYFG